MSTKIKSTLYRFVTMRAPSLLEPEEVIKSFVLHPETEKEIKTSDFLNAVATIPNNSTRAQVLRNTATNYAKTDKFIKDKKKLSELVGSEFYEYALWLTKNRSTFTSEVVIDKIKTVNTSMLTNFDAIEIRLWDNLFYQIVTSKSSYVREAILSLLVARFFIRKNITANNSLKQIRKLAQARVILPKTLFSPEDNSTAIAARKSVVSELPVSTKALQKNNDLLIIENRKSGLEAIKKALSIVEKKYKIVNNENLQSYNAQYDTDVKSAYAAATKVEKTYTNPTTSEVVTYYEYENLNLPEYNFKAIGQLSYCLSSSNGNQIYTNLITYCKDELLHTTFEEVNSYINNALSDLTTQLFQRIATSNRVANVDGVIISSNSNGIHARTEGVFALQSIYTHPNKYIALTFTTMEADTDIVSGNYTITFDNGDVFHGDYQDESILYEFPLIDNPNNILKLNIFNYVDSDNVSHYYNSAGMGSFIITGSFKSSTGRILTIDGKGWSRDYVAEVPEYSEELPISRGGGTYKYEDLIVGNTGTSGSNDTETGTNTNEVPDDDIISSTSVLEQIPSGYGIKRLGIADYRKVEQEVCCYVPGEVSHIENVMAREYKEKSTRRLRRQEDTVTTSKEKETEKLTDSTSTERFEMNQEVSSVMAEDTHLGANMSFTSNLGFGSLTVGADFAHNTTQETSDLQAVTNSKEITERVLERVVQKVKEERVTKIIEEFEENSKHGYDNRKGDQHISGVYRWVDKIYRNQIVNYGKRLMYEFMIPEPATFHNLAIERKMDTNGVEIIEKPIDPRTVVGSLALTDFTKIDINTYPHWAAIYNAEVEPMPEKYISVGKGFNLKGDKDNFESNSTNGEVKIPQGYVSISGNLHFSAAEPDQHANSKAFFVSFGEHIDESIVSTANKLNTEKNDILIGSYYDAVPVSFLIMDYYEGKVNATVRCELTANAEKKWQIETFNAIISAYEDRLKEYNDKMAALKGMQVQKLKSNPLFYRQIENTVLRKNCIEYMISQNELGGTTLTEGANFHETHVLYDDIKLETYAGKVKFFEQAFEWNLMSYYFYPFYWAPKAKWQDLYNVEEVDDPLFRSFLQSGMARVIITVRPGFEELVNWYMATGQVWNGGQVPTMNDPLFISIVKELQEPEGVVEETWESRVPTSLTVIQAGTIGLNVDGLPCDDDCDEYKQFDSDGNQVFNPDGTPVILENPIAQNLDTVQLGNITDELVEVSDSIEEIKTDIEEIKTTLDTIAAANN